MQCLKQPAYRGDIHRCTVSTTSVLTLVRFQTKRSLGEASYSDRAAQVPGPLHSETRAAEPSRTIQNCKVNWRLTHGALLYYADVRAAIE